MSTNQNKNNQDKKQSEFPLPEFQNSINLYCFDEEKAKAYFESLQSELKFLWQDAHNQDNEEMRERKLQQFWSIYRMYREYKDNLKQLT